MALLRETECKDVICDLLLRGREGATTFYSLPIVQHLSIKIQPWYCRNQDTAPPIQPHTAWPNPVTIWCNKDCQCNVLEITASENTVRCNDLFQLLPSAYWLCQAYFTHSFNQAANRELRRTKTAARNGKPGYRFGDFFNIYIFLYIYILFFLTLYSNESR